jgi:hypothetical protein
MREAKFLLQKIFYSFAIVRWPTKLAEAKKTASVTAGCHVCCTHAHAALPMQGVGGIK